MLGFLRRFRQRGADVPFDDDPEIQEELEDGFARVRRAEAAGALPVLETQHRAIGADVCHLAIPASMPDRADAFGKLFVTNRRLIFSGPAPLALGIGRIGRVTRQQRDLVIAGGPDGPLRFRCNSFGDAMLAEWLVARLTPRSTP